MSDAAEVLEPELMKRELSVLAPAEAEPLKAVFLKMFGQAEKWVAQAKSLNVTDASQLREMKMAREARLALREIRCNAENVRKKFKADIVLKGRAIDGIANVLKALIEPAEAHLEEQEKFAERMEAKRIADLVAVRSAELTALATDPAFYRLGDMTPDAYAQLVASIKAAAAAKIEASRKAEAEQIAREEADKAERARVVAENARLQAEAVEREKAAQIEREKAAKALAAAEAKAAADRKAAEAEAKAERDAREKAEAQLKAQRKAADEKAAAEALAFKQAAAAPDRNKILALAATVRGIGVPDMATEPGRAARVEIVGKIEAFAKWIEGKAKAL